LLFEFAGMEGEKPVRTSKPEFKTHKPGKH